MNAKCSHSNCHREADRSVRDLVIKHSNVPSQSRVSFICRMCGGANERYISQEMIQVLSSMGAIVFWDVPPFGTDKSGPPLTYDDPLDLVLELEGDDDNLSAQADTELRHVA